jgi:hypothetical protein
MSRSDPIRARYYEAVELTDRVSDALFYVGALLSIMSLLVEKQVYPNAYDVVMSAFVVAVIALFTLGLASRLYLTPRADDKRRQDFFSSAFRVGLTHEKTEGYYNNDFVEPNKRMAAPLLENSHFSKAIAIRMARFERTKVAVYALVWLLCLLNRQTDLGIVVAASQAVFSEQVVSKWLRLEWLRIRFEKTYDDVYRLFQSSPAASNFSAMTLESLGVYETAKATGAITLSSRMFRQLNDELSLNGSALRRNSTSRRRYGFLSRLFGSLGTSAPRRRQLAASVSASPLVSDGNRCIAEVRSARSDGCFQSKASVSSVRVQDLSLAT